MEREEVIAVELRLCEMGLRQVAVNITVFFCLPCRRGLQDIPKHWNN